MNHIASKHAGTPRPSTAGTAKLSCSFIHWLLRDERLRPPPAPASTSGRNTRPVMVVEKKSNKIKTSSSSKGRGGPSGPARPLLQAQTHSESCIFSKTSTNNPFPFIFISLSHYRVVGVDVNEDNLQFVPQTCSARIVLLTNLLQSCFIFKF